MEFEIFVSGANIKFDFKGIKICCLEKQEKIYFWNSFKKFIFKNSLYILISNENKEIILNTKDLGEKEEKLQQLLKAVNAKIVKDFYWGKLKCPCCGYYTIDDDRTEIIIDICPICFWQYDRVSHTCCDISIGPNKVSLQQGRKNYLEFGACEKRLSGYVRKPLVKEILKYKEKG